MAQDRLKRLAILSIENEVAFLLSYDEIIREFATVKSCGVFL